MTIPILLSTLIGKDDDFGIGTVIKHGTTGGIAVAADLFQVGTFELGIAAVRPREVFRRDDGPDELPKNSHEDYELFTISQEEFKDWIVVFRSTYFDSMLLD